MRAGGGKQKGAAFERSVCRHLSLWITEGKKEDVFWRSAMSGGRATLLHRKGKAAQNSAGDITATGEEGHTLTDQFYIECKCYRDLNILPFFFGNDQGALCKFWAATILEASKHKKLPLLIAKQNSVPPFVVLSWVGSGQILPLGTAGGQAKKLRAESALRGPRFAFLPPAGVSLYWFGDLFPIKGATQ